MELMDVSAVVAETVEFYSKLSTDRSIVVLKDCDSGDVIGDPELVRLALSQLLDNACKYSAPGSAVTVLLQRLGNYITLRVLSTGTVIPATERQKIFDRFYRGIDGHRMAPGSGLGLYVARKIALAHGGSLDLDTEHAPPDGAAFCLMLPVPESERREPVILPAAV